jgi:hypothetical protein
MNPERYPQIPTIQQPPQYQDPQVIVIEDHRSVPIYESESHHHSHKHHESWDDRIPVVSKLCALIILLLNIFLPGWGTIVLGIISPHHTSFFILIGFLQFILTGIIIGWVWSIITGVKVWIKASNHNINNI